MSRTLRLASAALALAAAGIAGCSDPAPAPTPTPSPPPQEELLEQADRFALEFAAEPTAPVPTPARTPIAFPTPAPAYGRTRIMDNPSVPDPDYGQVAIAGGGGGDLPNLVPHAPDGWDGPVTASGADGTLRTDAETAVGLAVANAGGAGAGGQFFVDLYLDDLLVQRFPVRRELGRGHLASWSDYRHLSRLVRIGPGEHTLSVVVDSTDLIAESDETDNVHRARLTWEGPEPAPRAAPEAGRGVNLTPHALPEWGVAVVAAAARGDVVITRGPYEPVHAPPKEHASPLSAISDTFVAYAIANTGNLSHPGDVLVDLYLDDTLVLRDRWTNMIARQRVHRSPWGGLADVVRIEPGRHVLRVVIDPNDLVAETDETDNVYSRELEWSAGPAGGPGWTPGFPPAPEAPEVLTLPNLVPGWLWEWDGPIVVDSVPGTITDGPVSAAGDAYVDVVVFNRSPVPAGPGFAVDLYLDGVLVSGMELSGPTPARSFRVMQDWAGLARAHALTPGPHVLRMVIDPDDRVREADETDNVFEKRLVLTDGPADPPGRTTYTEAQLAEALSGLGELLMSSDPVLTGDGRGDAGRVIMAADAGLYLLTGTSFRDERISAMVLPRPMYVAWIDETYDELFAVGDGTSHEALARGREWDKAVSLAKKQRRRGVIEVAVDGGHPFGDVLSSLVHELGHALQDRLHPAQTEAGDHLELAAIREAQAQQLERAFWLAVEDFTGERYMRYPDYAGYRAYVDVSLSADLSSLSTSEHALGRMIQWLAVLADPNLSSLRDELEERGGLGAGSSLALYLYLARLDPALAGEYVGGLLPSLGRALPGIASIARGRLETLGSPLSEGSPYLRHAALLAP